MVLGAEAVADASGQRSESHPSTVCPFHSLTSHRVFIQQIKIDTGTVFSDNCYIREMLGRWVKEKLGNIQVVWC